MQKFRLATLLKIREQERDKATQDVADARNAIHKLEAAKLEVLDENERMNEFRKLSSLGAVNMQTILDSQRYQMLLSAQVQQLDEHLGKLRQELERREATLLHRQQGVKSLEKLGDQKSLEWEQKQSSALQHTIDEWASVRFASDIQSSSNQ